MDDALIYKRFSVRAIYKCKCLYLTSAINDAGQSILGGDTMAKHHNLMDIVSTPFGGFAMVEIVEPESERLDSRIIHETRLAEPLAKLCREFMPHLYELADKYPLLDVGEMRCVCYCMRLSPGKLGSLVKDKNINRFAATIANKQRQVNELGCCGPEDTSTPEEVYECIKAKYLYGIWKELIKQEAENFFSCGYENLGGIKLTNHELKIAPGSVLIPSKSHFSVYDASTVSEWNGLIYPVKTLELRLREKVECKNPEEFKSRF